MTFKHTIGGAKVIMGVIMILLAVMGRHDEGTVTSVLFGLYVIFDGVSTISYADQLKRRKDAGTW